MSETPGVLTDTEQIFRILSYQYDRRQSIEQTIENAPQQLKDADRDIQDSRVLAYRNVFNSESIPDLQKLALQVALSSNTPLGKEKEVADSAEAKFSLIDQMAEQRGLPILSFNEVSLNNRQSADFIVGDGKGLKFQYYDELIKPAIGTIVKNKVLEPLTDTKLLYSYTSAKDIDMARVAQQAKAIVDRGVHPDTGKLIIGSEAVEAYFIALIAACNEPDYMAKDARALMLEICIKSRADGFDVTERFEVVDEWIKTYRDRFVRSLGSRAVREAVMAMPSDDHVDLTKDEMDEITKHTDYFELKPFETTLIAQQINFNRYNWVNEQLGQSSQ